MLSLDMENAESAAVAAGIKDNFDADPPSGITQAEHLRTISIRLANLQRYVVEETSWYPPKLLVCNSQMMAILAMDTSFRYPTTKVSKGELQVKFGRYGMFSVRADENCSMLYFYLRYRVNGPNLASLLIQNTYFRGMSADKSPIEMMVDSITGGCPELTTDGEGLHLFNFCPQCGAAVYSGSGDKIVCGGCSFTIGIVKET